MNLKELLASLPRPPWYRRWFPWLPLTYYVRPVRLFGFKLDVPTYSDPVTGKHLFDWLRAVEGDRIVGFQLWVPRLQLPRPRSSTGESK